MVGSFFCYSRSCYVQFGMQYVCTVRHVAGADGSCICNVVDCGDCFLWLAEIVRALGCFYLPAYIRGPQCLGVRGPFAVEKRNETKRKGKWKMENKRKTPGPLAAAFLHRIGLPIPTPGQDACGGWLGQEMDPRNPASTRPQPDGTPSVPASTNRTFFEIRVACPSLPLQGGGACWGGQGGHILTGAPRCISVCPASFLSPTLRQSHQGIWAGNRGCISRCRLFWSRVSQMVRPRPPPPPFPLLLQSLPPPPLSAPNLAPRTSHTTTPGGPLTPCTTLPCILAPDAIVGQTVCGYLPVTSGTVDNPPLPSPPRLLVRQPAGMDGPIHGQPRKGYFAICNLQSAPASRHRSAW